MKVICYTKYSAEGASSRLRFYGYAKILREQGIELTISPLLGADYVAQLQTGKKSLLPLLKGYLRRIVSLLRQRREFDLVWLEKELFPWLPYLLERLFWPRRVPVVIDYDDAVFHLYDRSTMAVIQKLLGAKHERLNSICSATTPGNRYLAKYCGRWGARKVELIPTVIDLEKYVLTRKPQSRSSPIRVVWIGQRSTAHFLKIIEPVIRKLTAEGLIKFVVIGGTPDLFDFDFEPVQWTEETEVSSISNCDLGVMPLLDEPFERGKCGYKLIQYMACGLPVVASPVGVNIEIVEPGINGYLAANLEEWESAIRELALSVDKSIEMGKKGRFKVENEYSVQVTAPRVSYLFKELAKVF